MLNLENVVLNLTTPHFLASDNQRIRLPQRHSPSPVTVGSQKEIAQWRERIWEWNPLVHFHSFAKYLCKQVVSWFDDCDFSSFLISLLPKYAHNHAASPSKNLQIGLVSKGIFLKFVMSTIPLKVTQSKVYTSWAFHSPQYCRPSGLVSNPNERFGTQMRSRGERNLSKAWNESFLSLLLLLCFHWFSVARTFTNWKVKEMLKTFHSIIGGLYIKSVYIYPTRRQKHV